MQRRSFKFKACKKKKKNSHAKYIREKQIQSSAVQGVYLSQRLCVKYAYHLILHSISNNNNAEAAKAAANLVI